MVISNCILKEFHAFFMKTAGEDFESMIETVQFVSEGQQCVTIRITRDMILENEEQFIAVLRSKDSAVHIIDQPSATITILDADCMK